MQRKILFAGICLVFVLAGNAFAAPPPSVSGLQAEPRDDGSIVVSWNKPEEESVAYYRVYYSQNSILGNNGVYDDFEQTDGAKELFVFQEPPVGDMLFVAVLAVNNDGEESDYFTEEVSISLSNSSAPSLVPIETDILEEPETASSNGIISEPPPEEQASAIPLEFVELFRANATSATGITLTFSTKISISPEEVRDAVKISTAGSGMLAITQLRIRDTEVSVETDLQEPDIVYNVTVSEPLRGANDEPLDQVARSVFFKGYKGTEKEQEKKPLTADPAVPPTDVSDVQFSSEEVSPGVHRVSVRWNRSTLTQPVAQYLVSQSLDGGTTLSDPFPVPGNAYPLDIEGVPRGSLGLFIRVVDVYGRVTPGVFNMTQVPVPKEVSVPTQANAPEDEVNEWNTTDDLPDAGATFVILSMTVTGAVAGWRHTRRRRKNA